MRDVTSRLSRKWRDKEREQQAKLLMPGASAGRVPPHDLDAEASVLSACMLSREAVDVVLAILSPEHFYSDANGRIFEAIRELASVGTGVDIVSIASYLRDRDRLAQVGGPVYIAGIADATPAVAHVADHARVVYEKWRVRALIATCQRVAAEAYGDIGDVQEFFEEAEHEITTLGQAGRTTDTLTHVGPIVDAAYASTSTMANTGKHFSGLATGIERFDTKVGGLKSGDLTIVAARPGMGKAQPLTSKVLTPRGWRCIGDLAIGDEVIGSDGCPTRVTGVFPQGKRDVYRVTMDDGGWTFCCAEHLWLTRTRRDRRAGRAGSVKQLSELIGTISRADSGGRNHSLPLMGPAQFEPIGTLPIDPWLMGVFLGDGSFASASCATIHKPEKDLLARVAASLPEGDAVTPIEGGAGVRVRKAKPGPDQSATARELERMGLRGLETHEKFIPEVYLRASVEERVKLLRGLCDTDGYVTDPCGKSIELSTSSPRLRDGIVFLVGSLGGRVTWVPKQGVYTKDGERHVTLMSYRMTISFPRGGVVPVSTEKHLAKWNTDESRIGERFIDRIELACHAECVCIAVDAPDHLYVTDDFIVTHNTSLVLGWAVTVASKKRVELQFPDGGKQDVEEDGAGVLVFSLEMPREQLGARMNSTEGRVDLGKVLSGYLDPDDWKRLVDATAYLRSLPIWIDDKSGASLQYIRAKVRKLKAELEAKGRKLGLVIVDYLQLMTANAGSKAQNREQEIAEMSRGLKQLAKEEKVAIIALSQLSRACEARADKRPMLSDLRESGAIEADADNIVFVYRDEYYSPDTTQYRGLAELILGKQRNGPPGKVLTRFTGSCTRFDNLHAGDYPEHDDQ